MQKIDPARLEYVERLYLAGRSSKAIQELACKRFGVTTRAVRYYLKIVTDRLAALPKPDPEAQRTRAEAMLLEAYRLARKGGRFGPDSKAMVAATARLAELDGLLTKKVEHGGTVGVDPAALLRRVQEAAARDRGDDEPGGAGGAASGGPGGDRGGPG